MVDTTDINARGYVFRRVVGGVYRATGSTSRSFRTALKKAGISDFRFHDLRHCAVTNMRRSGMPDRVVMAISGHKTLSMLTRYDSGPQLDELKAAIVKFSKCTSDQSSDQEYEDVERAL